MKIEESFCFFSFYYQQSLETSVFFKDHQQWFLNPDSIKGSNPYSNFLDL